MLFWILENTALKFKERECVTLRTQFLLEWCLNSRYFLKNIWKGRFIGMELSTRCFSETVTQFQFTLICVWKKHYSVNTKSYAFSTYEVFSKVLYSKALYAIFHTHLALPKWFCVKCFKLNVSDLKKSLVKITCWHCDWY